MTTKIQSISGKSFVYPTEEIHYVEKIEKLEAVIANLKKENDDLKYQVSSLKSFITNNL